MRPALLLDTLTKAGAEMRVEGGRLVVKVPDSLDNGLRRQLADQEEVLLQLLQRRGRAGWRPPLIEPDHDRRFEPFELTEIQQAYWLGRNPCLELGNVGIHVYHELDCTELDLPRLNRAWGSVIERHDMLRAVLLPDGRQMVRRHGCYDIEVSDLRGESAAQRRKRLQQLREQMSHHVYSPDEWPMFRIVACRLPGGLTRLFVSVDALNLDMGSLAIVFSDWVRFYTAPDQTPPPPELSFRDYALALQSLRETEAYRESLHHWEQRIAELPPAPALPMAIRPKDLTRQRFVRCSDRLAAEPWTELKRRAAAAGLTPSGLTLAAFAEVVAGWSSSPSFTLNVTLFNRLPLHPQVGEIAGDFTSMILLAIDAGLGKSFEERATEIQRRLWRDMRHRYVSGVEVLRRLGRRLGKPPGEALMPCVFTSTLSTRARGLLPLRRLGEPVFGIVQTPQVGLDLQVSEEEGRLTYHLDSVEGLYSPAVVEAMFDAYRRLIHDLARGKRRWRQSRRPLAPPDQLKTRVPVNATKAPIPELTLPELLARTAQEHAARPALFDRAGVLTHGQLDRLSNRIGRALKRLGARRNDLVAVVAPKGSLQVAGVLGSLKAGAAYLPIDPGVPGRRLRSLLEHGQARIALTLEACARSLDWPSDLTLLRLDGNETAAESDKFLEPSTRPRDLAYVLYTSGSTGAPKGVMIEHRSVVNRMLDINSRFKVGPADRALALTALHHDLSVYDVFGVLAAGGALIFPEAEAAADPAGCLEPSIRHGLTLWNSVPAFMELMIDYLEHRRRAGTLPKLPPLRLVLLSGDWIPTGLPDRIRAFFEGVQLVSLGGPTETTVWDICHPIGEIDAAWKSIPYGRPLRNASHHILNQFLEPCPDWVAGEIHIGGTGLMRGYWRDPEKTAEAFVRHPDTGERLYRSGDMGRWLPGGTIEILGRKDSQIKLRGHRIEPGEIEETLRRHPRVQDAIVVARGADSRERCLVACVVASDAPRADIEDAQHCFGCDDTGDLGRFEFKLRRHGVRNDLPKDASIALSDNGSGLSPELYRRQSHREFSDQALSLSQVSRWLDCLACVRLEGRTLPKFRYPSAGSLYPVQTYLSVRSGGIDGMPAGTYYHHPVDRTLLPVSRSTLQPEAHVASNRGFAPAAPICLLLVGCLPAIEPVYGPLARDFCLIEAGAMIQLLMEEAAKAGMGVCPIGEIDSAAVGKLLDLNFSHQHLSCLVGGIPVPTPSSRHPKEPLSVELRRFLADRLPEHMVPTRFVQLQSFPLTPNGKIDRRALQAGEEEEPLPILGASRDAGTRMESLVASLCGVVLGLKDVDVTKRFSELGAHSMHLVRIALRLSETLGREVEVIELFRHPTPAALAHFLGAREETAAFADDAAKRAERRRATLAGRRRLKKGGGQP